MKRIRVSLLALLLVLTGVQSTVSPLGYAIDLDRERVVIPLVAGTAYAALAASLMAYKASLNKEIKKLEELSIKMAGKPFRFQKELNNLKAKRSVVDGLVKLSAGAAGVAWLFGVGAYCVDQWDVYQEYTSAHQALKLFSKVPAAAVDYAPHWELGMYERGTDRMVYRPGELSYLRAVIDKVRISNPPMPEEACCLSAADYLALKSQHEQGFRKASHYSQWLEGVAARASEHPQHATPEQRQQADHIRSSALSRRAELAGWCQPMPENLAAQWEAMRQQGVLTLESAARSIVACAQEHRLQHLIFNDHLADYIRPLLEECERELPRPLVDSRAELTPELRAVYSLERDKIRRNCGYLRNLEGKSNDARGLRERCERVGARIDALLSPEPVAAASAAAASTDVRPGAVARDASDDDAATGDAPSGKPAVSVAAPTATGLVATAAGTTPAPTAPPVIAHDDEGNPSSAPDAH